MLLAQSHDYPRKKALIQVSRMTLIVILANQLDRPVGLDYVTPDEAWLEIEEIKKKKATIQEKIEGYKNQQRLLHMCNQRAKIAGSQPVSDVKEICGYDNRLAFNNAQFARWSKTEEGKTALETGVLGPRTPETKAIGAVSPFPGQVFTPPPIVPATLNNLCLKGKRSASI